MYFSAYMAYVMALLVLWLPLVIKTKENYMLESVGALPRVPVKEPDGHIEDSGQMISLQQSSQAVETSNDLNIEEHAQESIDWFIDQLISFISDEAFDEFSFEVVQAKLRQDLDDIENMFRRAFVLCTPLTARLLFAKDMFHAMDIAAEEMWLSRKLGEPSQFFVSQMTILKVRLFSLHVLVEKSLIIKDDTSRKLYSLWDQLCCLRAKFKELPNIPLILRVHFNIHRLEAMAMITEIIARISEKNQVDGTSLLPLPFI